MSVVNSWVWSKRFFNRVEHIGPIQFNCSSNSRPRRRVISLNSMLISRILNYWSWITSVTWPCVLSTKTLVRWLLKHWIAIRFKTKMERWNEKNRLLRVVWVAWTNVFPLFMIFPLSARSIVYQFSYEHTWNYSCVDTPTSFICINISLRPIQHRLQDHRPRRWNPTSNRWPRRMIAKRTPWNWSAVLRWPRVARRSTFYEWLPMNSSVIYALSWHVGIVHWNQRWAMSWLKHC